MTENDTARDDGPDPAARSMVDGLETWDLTQEPSAEAFGIAEDDRAGIYETDEARTVVLLLPGEERLEVETKALSFERTGTASGERFRLGVRGPTVPKDQLVEQLRSLTDQLGVDPAGVEDYASELADVDDEQTERVRYSSPSATFDALELGVSANVAPIADGGRFVLGGVWR
ncbi:hypothetical protein ACHAAC_16625 [Aeromicrobium sp. CF4.19]|uniref:hypothetical protein n=1 Tax=Aeromicrobium sp. CF4.19 TaxID=3373082 RepID=UPI003EE52730